MKRADLTGAIYHRIRVIEYAGTKPLGIATWNCACDCGAIFIATSYSLTSGSAKSCGCHRREQLSAPRKHGMAKTIEFRTWVAMRRRCFYQNNKEFVHYGGRGITVCPQWINSFSTFFADMGFSPGPEYSIDRINNDGDYEPANCRWATRIMQANNKRTSVIISHNGENRTISEWASKADIPMRTFWARLRTGWSMDDALSIRPKYGNRRDRLTANKTRIA